MALQTFPTGDIYKPNQDSGGRTRTARVLSNSLGDGYISRVGDGLNPIMDRWDLNWTHLPRTPYLAIRNFLDARAGLEAFMWTPPGETVAQAVINANMYRDKPLPNDLFEISATFETWYGVR